MTTQQLGSTALILCALLVSGGCTRQGVRAATTHEVDINNCSAPQVDVKHNDKVHWNSKDLNTDYTIEFSSDDPTPSPFTVTGTSSPAHVMKGHSKCIHNYATNGCWYKYTITKVGANAPCSDPIIHIEPGS